MDGRTAPFDPSRVAVVDATDREGSVGRALLENLPPSTASSSPSTPSRVTVLGPLLPRPRGHTAGRAGRRRRPARGRPVDRRDHRARASTSRPTSVARWPTARGPTPSSAVLGAADGAGLAVLSVWTDTLTTVERAEAIVGGVRVDDPDDVDRVRTLLAEHADLEALLEP